METIQDAEVFAHVVPRLSAGTWVRYHRGVLMADRKLDRRLNRLADQVMRMSDMRFPTVDGVYQLGMSLVTLVQHRIDENNYEYFAIRLGGGVR